MEEAKREKYYDLRYRLSHHVLKGNDDHQRLMSTATARGLTPIELYPADFTNLCNVFHRKGLLGPEKLDILKEIFPRDKNDKAYNNIMETEKEISELIQGSSDGNRQPRSSGSDQFAKDTRALGERKTKETIAEMLKAESIMPVKRKKRKLTTGENGEQSRKDGKEIPKGTPRSLHVAAKKFDRNKSYSLEDIGKKLEESDQPASEQNTTRENAAEGKEVGPIWKIAGDLVWTENLKMALNAKNYEEAQKCATHIIKKFKQHMNEMEKYLVYTAWMGYMPCENGDIAFQNIRIVSLTNKSCTAPQTSFLKIPIRWRLLHEVSSEAEETTHLEDIDVNIKHSEKNKVDSEELFRDHSNLTMVHVSSFKSINFNTNEHKIDKQPCFALYCRVKGVIPLGENPFPTSWGELPTDVREGYCTLGAGDTLQPGVDIQCIDANKSGTVGGFIENEAGKKWFITAAHIFANITQLREDNATKEERFRSGNIIVHKNQQRIGKVVRGSFSYADITTETSIDAAVVEIDETGLSVNYNFPETDDTALSGTVHITQNTATSKFQREYVNVFNCKVNVYSRDCRGEYCHGHQYLLLGYSNNKLPTVRSNTLLSKTEIKENRRLQVMKYGSSTKLTTGSIAIDKLDVVFHDLTMKVVDVRPNTGVKKKQPFRFCGQMGVRSCSEKPFFKTGDSGAFCFMLDQDDELSVRSFGLAIGRMSSGTCIVTPLDEVFRKLNLNDEMILSSMHQPTIPDQKKETEGLKRMLEKLLDQKFEQADRKSTQKFEQADRKSTQKFEQADRKSDQKFEGVYKSLSAIKEDVEQLKKKVNMDIL